MKQNSTKNMMLRHLKVIKAKIEQKSIHNMKLPFINKYAGRSCDCVFLSEKITFIMWFSDYSVIQK